MKLREILSPERILIDSDGTLLADKSAALQALARLLAPAVEAPEPRVLQLLVEREQLQSTGIGEGVAIPHASAEDAPRQAAAVLLCPKGLAFDAIDGAPVTIVFGVIGPRRATGEHLRTLARISRLLRDAGSRAKLGASADAQAAFLYIDAQDAAFG
jgi:PTS system nitrogen regulatory IIA component